METTYDYNGDAMTFAEIQSLHNSSVFGFVFVLSIVGDTIVTADGDVVATRSKP